MHMVLRPLVILIACLICTSQKDHAYAAEHAVVFYFNEHHQPVARLDRLHDLTPPLRALLALYALENGAGCEGKDEYNRVRCKLTEELGLGSNCSEAHIKLVRSWFDSTPNLTSRWHARWNARTKSPGALEDLCYGQPDTASWQNIWEIIKVKSTSDVVEVEAILRWGSQYGHGRVRYKNIYKIESQTITETAFEVTELSRSYESMFGGGDR